MRIFKYRDFSLMFFGRIVSNIGDSLYSVAAMLLIYELGGSTFYTGLAGFLSIFPRIVEFCSGPLIDKIPIRSLLVRTQFIQAGLLLIIPLAATVNMLSVTLVLVLTPIISTFNVLIYPAQLAALPKVLPEGQLTKGNSLFSMAYQGVDIAFNGLAGILFVAIGPFALYLVNAGAFFIGAIIFLCLRITNTTVKNKQGKEKQPIPDIIKKYREDLQEGLSIMFNSFIKKLLYGVIVLNLVSAATVAVFPEFGLVIGGTEYVGFLLMASAVGSLSGALLAPILKLERLPLGKMYIIGYVFAGCCWTLAALVPIAWLTLTLYMLAWIPAGALNIVMLTTLQKVSPKHMIGRIFTAATSLSGIAAPIGHLLGGSLGVWIGSAQVVALSGVVVLLVSFYWLVNRVVRELPATESLDVNSLTNQEIPVSGATV